MVGNLELILVLSMFCTVGWITATSFSHSGIFCIPVRNSMLVSGSDLRYISRHLRMVSLVSKSDSSADSALVDSRCSGRFFSASIRSLHPGLSSRSISTTFGEFSLSAFPMAKCRGVLPLASVRVVLSPHASTRTRRTSTAAPYAHA